jgi:hypothetical protein
MAAIFLLYGHLSWKLATNQAHGITVSHVHVYMEGYCNLFRSFVQSRKSRKTTGNYFANMKSGSGLLFLLKLTGQSDEDATVVEKEIYTQNCDIWAGYKRAHILII